MKTFESDMKNLEDLIAELESGDLNLSSALEAFEKGVSLYKNCHLALESAEQKVKILMDDLDQGQKIKKTLKLRKHNGF